MKSKVITTKLNKVLDALRAEGFRDDAEIIEACQQIERNLTAVTKLDATTVEAPEGRDPMKILNFNKKTGEMEYI